MNRFKWFRKGRKAFAAFLALALAAGGFPGGTLAVQAEGNGNTLTTDGGSVEWNFTDENAAIYSGQDGSLSVTGTCTVNAGGHGADISDDTVFTLQIPAGQTTVTFGVCTYGSSTAKISAGDEVLAEAFLLNGAAEDGQEASIQYTSEAAAEIKIEVSGNGYLHKIAAETITPPQVAAVSGQVAVNPSSASVVGQVLVFTDQNGDTQETAIGEDGGYSISLPVGQSYTVSFKNSDIYDVTEGETLDLTGTGNGEPVSWNISCQVIWDTSKIFSFGIDDTIFTAAPGASPADDFSVSASGGSGSVELAATDTAIIWADLGGAGTGTLTEGSLHDVSGNVTYTIADNTITFTYTDAVTAPAEYRVQVKDNSASGTPHADGSTHSYDFRDGSVLSTLYSKEGRYALSGGRTVSSTDGLLTLVGNNEIAYNDASHGIIVKNGDQVRIRTAGSADIAFELCGYSGENDILSAAVGSGVSGTITPASCSAQAAADGGTAAFHYTGDPTELTFTYNGSGTGYLHAVSVTNLLPETAVRPQTEMPEIKEWGAGSALTASPAGQCLQLSQKGGSLPTGEALSSDVSYYGFEMTAEQNRLEADVTVDSCGSSSSNGVFFGAFNGAAIETVGIRGAGNLRGVYSDENEVKAGRINETIEEGQTVHFTAERTEDGFVITAAPEGGAAYTAQSSSADALFADENAEISFGFILADASVTVTNMKYYSADGTLLYDQNDCYEPLGEAPVVTGVSASGAPTRDAIHIAWSTADLPYGDGRFVIQARKDGGSWEIIGETQNTSYSYAVTEPGTYEFQVGGRLGSAGEITWCSQTAAVESFLPALPAPEPVAEGGSSSITLTWQPVEEASVYEIYRYSSDEGADAAVKLAEVTELSYTDETVSLEVPYYYYIIARSAGNSSNPSAMVWAVSSVGHTGEYVFEEEAAGITLTSCPDSTVFQDTITISGAVDRAGVMRAYVNDGALTAAAAEQEVAAGGSFDLKLALAAGRNDVKLIFTDTEGKATCLTYNFVYLTEYDMMVDASYTGAVGRAADGIPVYKTVQEAVDAVPADNTERTVIFIKNGDYEEQLTISSPYISLVGEDEEGVRIHCYPADLHPEDPAYEAGGDMDKRCAVYVTAGAQGFSAENLTFANDYVYGTEDGKSNKSADALRCDADGAVFVNVTLSGVQDTLYMHQGDQYFYKCRIEGLVDFVYAGDNARALFEECELVFVYEETHPDGGYVCAPRTAADSEYGLIFYNCAVTSEDGCEAGSFHLARPWGPDAAIYWINCYMGSAINAEEPYAEMSGNPHEAARFYEYGSYGPGYAVNGDRRQISPNQAETLLLSAVEALGEAAYEGNIESDLASGALEPEQPDPENPPTDLPSETPDDGDTGSGNAGSGDTGSGDTGSGNTGGGNTSEKPSGSSSGGSSGGSTSSEAAQVKSAQGAATGDNADAALWMAVLLAAGAVLISAAVVWNRKRL